MQPVAGFEVIGQRYPRVRAINHQGPRRLITAVSTSSLPCSSVSFWCRLLLLVSHHPLRLPIPLPFLPLPCPLSAHSLYPPLNRLYTSYAHPQDLPKHSNSSVDPLRILRAQTPHFRPTVKLQRFGKRYIKNTVWLLILMACLWICVVMRSTYRHVFCWWS